MKRMELSFFKMQGAGNDYVFMDCRQTGYAFVPEELAVRISRRRFSVGSDGLVLILPSVVADVRMRMFNADGSEGAMCGNAIRCLGKYLYERCGMENRILTVETKSGIRRLHLSPEKQGVQVSVEMGRAVVQPPRLLPFTSGMREVVPVSVGNPHAVTFVPDTEALVLERLGPETEKHPAFPGGVNAEFVTVKDRRTLQMRVWERGSGETLACGTGACAAVAAACCSGVCERDILVSVLLPGGRLSVCCDAEGFVSLSGDAVWVYEGVYTDAAADSHS